jgi:hypothetical protein
MNRDLLRALFRFTLAAGMGLLAVSASMHRALAETKGPEQREAVVTKDDPKARERVIALAQFGYWLSGNKDGRMETAVTDLNGDGTAEIFIRLVDATTCDADRKVCKTMGMKHDGKEWKVIFDRPTSSIELGKAGKDGMRGILVNGYEVRSWNGRFYQIDVGAMKTTQVKLQAESNGARAIELARGFGNAAEKLVATKKAVISAGSKAMPPAEPISAAPSGFWSRTLAVVMCRSWRARRGLWMARRISKRWRSCVAAGTR